MKAKIMLLVSLFVLCGLSFAQTNSATVKPVTPEASTEAMELLNYLYSISGKNTLTGQHSVPLLGSLRLPAVERTVGKYPAVFGQDFGFSEPGTWDGINYRQQIVDEAIRRSNEGFIITIMWHAVRPNEEEPVMFRESIQGELSEAEWDSLITPGTYINEKWKSQVDVIAFFLKQLRNARVPVLWRPYHEMNGDWFWWGDKKGENGYKKLYRMLFDRLVDFHKINNLIWVYNANELNDNCGSYAEYFPGHEFVDVLATDVYRREFADDDYQTLSELANGKPIALGEVGSVPSLDKLEEQPNWTWFMSWGDPGSGGFEGMRNYRELYNSDPAVTWDELPWVNKFEKPIIHFPVLK